MSNFYEYLHLTFWHLGILQKGKWLLKFKKVAEGTLKVGNTCPMSATDDVAKAGG